MAVARRKDLHARRAAVAGGMVCCVGRKAGVALFGIPFTRRDSGRAAGEDCGSAVAASCWAGDRLARGAVLAADYFRGELLRGAAGNFQLHAHDVFARAVEHEWRRLAAARMGGVLPRLDDPRARKHDACRAGAGGVGRVGGAAPWKCASLAGCVRCGVPARASADVALRADCILELAREWRGGVAHGRLAQCLPRQQSGISRPCGAGGRALVGLRLFAHPRRAHRAHRAKQLLARGDAAYRSRAPR